MHQFQFKSCTLNSIRSPFGGWWILFAICEDTRSQYLGEGSYGIRVSHSPFDSLTGALNLPSQFNHLNTLNKERLYSEWLLKRQSAIYRVNESTYRPNRRHNPHNLIIFRTKIMVGYFKRWVNLHTAFISMRDREVAQLKLRPLKGFFESSIRLMRPIWNYLPAWFTLCNFKSTRRPHFSVFG